jgi:hypothetical protein
MCCVQTFVAGVVTTIGTPADLLGVEVRFIKHQVQEIWRSNKAAILAKMKSDEEKAAKKERKCRRERHEGVNNKQEQLQRKQHICMGMDGHVR